MSNIKLFESKKVRTHWDEKTEQWYFSVIDVIEILTESPNPPAPLLEFFSNKDLWAEHRIDEEAFDQLYGF